MLEAVTVIALDRSAEERAARAARAARQSLLAPVEEAERQIAARPITSVLAAMAAGCGRSPALAPALEVLAPGVMVSSAEAA